MTKRLPRHLAAQAEEAQRLETEMFGTPAAAEPEPAAVSAPVEPTPAAQPADDPNSPTWMQRYKTLQGEFNAKVPQLQNAVKTSTSQIDELKQRLAQLEAERPKPQLVTEKDAEEFGPDMLDLIGRKAREIAAEENAELRQLVMEMRTKLEATGQTVGSLAQAQVVDAEERFYSTLESAVPDYQSINTNPAWLGWLAEEDPVSGVVRQQALDDAARELNAKRVAAIFNAFKAQTAQAAPAPAPSRDTLSAQVVPQRSVASSPAPSGPAAEIVAGSEINAFYDAVRRNQLTPEQRTAGERRINTALAEGRVDPNR